MAVVVQVEILELKAVTTTAQGVVLATAAVTAGLVASPPPVEPRERADLAAAGGRTHAGAASASGPAQALPAAAVTRRRPKAVCRRQM